MSFEEQFDSNNNNTDHYDDDNIDSFDMLHDNNNSNEGEEYKINLDENNDKKEEEEKVVIEDDDDEKVEKPEEEEKLDLQKDGNNITFDNIEKKDIDEKVYEDERKVMNDKIDNTSQNSLEDLVKNTGIDAKKIISNSETKTIFDFKSFLNFLRDPKAEPILKYTKSFINQVLKSDRWYTFKEQKRLIEDFEDFIYKKFAIYEPFKLMNADDLNNCKDSMEKLLTNKLYAKIFSPIYYNLSLKMSKMNPNEKIDFPKDHLKLVKNDQQLWSNINKFGSIITLENLEIYNLTEVNADMLNKFFKVFNRELWKMGKFRSPRDKLVCLLNSCKIIFSYLKKIGNKGLTADDFMPLLIYSVLKLPALDSENYFLLSTASYIDNFRQANFLKGEESYYLMSFQGALQFILELNEENMFEKFKVKDTEFFTNKLNERKGLITATQLEKEEQIKQKKFEKKLHEKEEEELKQNQNSAAGSWPLSSWFGGSSPTNQEDSILSKFSNLITTTTTTTEDENKDTNQVISKEKNTEPSNIEIQQQIENQIKQSELEDLSSLKDMFPQLDEAIVKDIYILKNRNITQTIESILEML
ncbi:hypothetical protein HANVADRAFT_53738 [Hanseniaspora valbyensis NRRL Y-1626]|uniref:VPS9 domain-containing protein n=1 Tax=Hanseniaspora valbyensis NRRL Y-1626 TaxID=766949 RepID=A0A1B7TAD0_9ASCO|nr:hypothetical protein HANVADRAFT_53738 [Hanseniaspora valbyensis NRRL Y-1626]